MRLLVAMRLANSAEKILPYKIPQAFRLYFVDQPEKNLLVRVTLLRSGARFSLALHSSEIAASRCHKEMVHNGTSCTANLPCLRQHGRKKIAPAEFPREATDNYFFASLPLQRVQPQVVAIHAKAQPD